MNPFIIFGLPRSRTHWLSKFLTYRNWHCYHDLPLTVEGVKDLKVKLSQPNTGTVETGLTCGFNMFMEWFPQARIVVVRREVAEVKESARKIGWMFPEGLLEAEAERLDQISLRPNVLTISFGDLNEKAVCAELFRFCLEQDLPDDWWEMFKDWNIQVRPDSHLNRLGAKRKEIGYLLDQVNSYVTFHVEPLSALLRDGGKLFVSHRAEAGGFANLPFDPDIPPFEGMDKLGLLKIYTARTINHLVGYLVFIINPCLESRNTLLAFQNIWFVDKSFRGTTGHRLHAFARKHLAAIGVHAAICRAGVRADGPKLGRLYEDLGAKSMGELFFLPLGGL